MRKRKHVGWERRNQLLKQRIWKQPVMKAKCWNYLWYKTWNFFLPRTHRNRGPSTQTCKLKVHHARSSSCSHGSYRYPSPLKKRELPILIVNHFGEQKGKMYKMWLWRGNKPKTFPAHHVHFLPHPRRKSSKENYQLDSPKGCKSSRLYTWPKYFPSCLLLWHDAF